MIDDGAPGLPKAFGDYTLLKPLGRGGMGQVFLARLRARGLAGVDKICVVKTLRATNDPEYERRFIDEARLIVLLSHRNICPVFDAGCFEGQYYLALEHIAGRELRHLQVACEARGAPLPVPVVVHIIKETLEALDAAHRMVHPLTNEPLRVVHRDVSPQNVMISHEGEVKLIDFGLAVSSQKVERTAPQVVMGKMAYMAPEQARGEAVDARVDQFAAGIILYELLTNTRYYGDLSIDAMWRMSGVGGHRPAGLAQLDEDLREIVVRATAPRRDDRYPTCADMRDALTAAELRRGTVAGSREVRAALQALDGPSAPAPAVVTPVVAPVPSVLKTEDDLRAVTAPPPEPGHREKTRTFRLVAPAGDRTEVGLVEGLEPGSLITSEEQGGFSSSMLPTETQTADHDPGPAPPAAAVVDESVAPEAPVGRAAGTQRTEATVVVRHTDPPALHEHPPRRPKVAIAAILGALGVLGAVLLLRSTTADVVPVPVPPPIAVAVVPTPPPLDAVPPPAVVDAGVASVVVDGGSPTDPVDAGAVAAIVVEDAVDAGLPTSPKTPRVKTPRPRHLPAWPSTLQDKTSYLAQHCARLACAQALYGVALQAKLRELGRGGVEAEADKCYQRCR